MSNLTIMLSPTRARVTLQNPGHLHQKLRLAAQLPSSEKGWESPSLHKSKAGALCLLEVALRETGFLF